MVQATVRSLIAVDPGDEYVGVAFFEEREVDDEFPYGWECVDVQEINPDDFLDGLAELVATDGVDILVYESFRLYADKSREQTGSEMLTAQMIGVIKWLWRANMRHVCEHEKAEELGKMTTCELPGGVCHNPPRRPQHITLVKQRPDDKKPAKGICNRRGIVSVAKAMKKQHPEWGIHVADAELHGWFYILKVLQPE